MIKEFSNNQDDWNRLVESSSGISLMQLWEYGEAKKAIDGFQLERLVLEKNGKILMAFQVMLKLVPFVKKGVVYVNKPVYFTNDKKEILSAIEEFRAYWVDKRKLFLLCDLNLHESLFTSQEIFSLGFSLKKNDEIGWATDFLSLDKSEEELRKSLQQKWRNCLNKSEKLEVEIEIGNSENDVSSFVSDYQKVIDEVGFKPGVQPNFIAKLYELASDKSKYLVLKAKCKNVEVGSVIIPCFGDYAFYLASGAHKGGREMNASYKLLWEAAVAAKKMGKKYFDLGGVNDLTTPKGILHFKQGLGGVNQKWLPMMKAYKPGLINKLLLSKIEKS